MVRWMGDTFEFDQPHTALQIRAGQWSITANFQPLTAHIYYVMIIVASGFSNKSFITISFP